MRTNSQMLKLDKTLVHSEVKLQGRNLHLHWCGSAAPQHTLQHKRKCFVALFCLSKAKKVTKAS